MAVGEVEMTPKCIKTIDQLQQDSEAFCDLSIEQLLYACIIGSGLEDTQYVLNHTDWSKWCPNERPQDIKAST